MILISERSRNKVYIIGDIAEIVVQSYVYILLKLDFIRTIIVRTVLNFFKNLT